MLTQSIWTGPVAGSIAFGFNDDLRLADETVAGTPTVTFAYDDDEILTQAGALTLTPSPANGLLTGTALDQITTAQSYNAFGEPSLVTASQTGVGERYRLDVSDRDKLGRIRTKVETIGGAATTTAYAYDLAGRLDTVTVNGSLTRDYAYDPNGNRLREREDQGGAPIASYDDQDRLTSYQGATYQYTANGELLSGTDAGQTTGYAYDALGSLRHVDLPSTTADLDYVIDGQNR